MYPRRLSEILRDIFMAVAYTRPKPDIELPKGRPVKKRKPKKGK